MQKTVLILGANSDVAKAAISRYLDLGHQVIAASRSTETLQQAFGGRATILYFDAEDFDSHRPFYNSLPDQPHIVIYAAGFLRDNEAALRDWEGSFRMMKVH